MLDGGQLGTERADGQSYPMEGVPSELLRQGEAAALSVLHSSPEVAIWALSADMRVTWCSENAASQLAGRPPAELVGRSLHDLAPPQVVARMQRIADLLRARRSPILGSSMWRGRRMRSWFCPVWERSLDGVLDHVRELKQVLIFTMPAPLNLGDDASVFEADYAHLGEFSVLTRRELEVLAYLGQGLDTEQIAQRLHRSVKTIKRFREGIASKLGVGDRTRLALRARDAGLTPRHASLTRLN